MLLDEGFFTLIINFVLLTHADVDECTDPEKHNCEGTCENTVGSFRCHCALGMYVDAKGACKGFRLSTLVVGTSNFFT